MFNGEDSSQISVVGVKKIVERKEGSKQRGCQAEEKEEGGDDDNDEICHVVIPLIGQPHSSYPNLALSFGDQQQMYEMNED